MPAGIRDILLLSLLWGVSAIGNKTYRDYYKKLRKDCKDIGKDAKSSAVGEAK